MVLFLMMATYDSEGAMVQMGKPKSAGIAVSSLLYNEYIVYSLDQVRIKYLVQLVCTCFLFPPLLPAAVVSLCGFVATGLPLQADRVLTCVFLSSFFSSLFFPTRRRTDGFLFSSLPFPLHAPPTTAEKAKSKKKKKTDRR